MIQKGDKFGYLTVESENFEITRYPSGRRKTRIPCICICGNKIFVIRGDLQNGHTKSCGCFRRKFRSLPSGEAGFNELYRTYERSAKVRKISFELNNDLFRVLSKQNCYYCNKNPQA